MLALYYAQRATVLVTVNHLVWISYVILIRKELLEKVDILLLNSLSYQSIVTEHATLIESWVNT
jgi:hypothetical protein